MSRPVESGFLGALLTAHRLAQPTWPRQEGPHQGGGALHPSKPLSLGSLRGRAVWEAQGHLRSPPADMRVRPPWGPHIFPGSLLCAQPLMEQGFPSSQPQKAGGLPGGRGLGLGLVFVTLEGVPGLSPTGALKAGPLGHHQCLRCPISPCVVSAGWKRRAVAACLHPSPRRVLVISHKVGAVVPLEWEVRSPAQEHSPAHAVALQVCVWPGLRQLGRRERAIGGSKPGGPLWWPRLQAGGGAEGLSARMAGRSGRPGRGNSPGRGLSCHRLAHAGRAELMGLPTLARQPGSSASTGKRLCLLLCRWGN